MDLHPVQTRQDLKDFIELPYRIYRRDPLWVPPLRSDQWNQFDPKFNPTLAHCEYALFLLKEGRDVIGRISAFTDTLALEHWKDEIGLFGSYECVDNAGAAKLLLHAARDWLRKRGMKSMRGPWSFASQEWGLVLEGFSPPPVVMAPYNPPFYNDLLLAFGLQKVKDLLVFYIDSREGYRIPERYLKLTDRVQRQYGIRIRSADIRRLEKEVAIFVSLANRSIMGNWGYYPVTDDEGRAIARDLKPILDPDLVMFAEDARGEPIGFIIAFPDVNTLLQGLDGRLFPFGWIKLLWGLPRIRQYRVWGLGIVPEYQGKAVDALLYRRMYEVLAGRKNVRLELNYVLEDNHRMLNALYNLKVKPLRRYRVYQMEI